MGRIAFGTSGWRGVLGEEFVVENIKIVVRAIADHVISNGESAKGIIVGHDTRFMGERFARKAAGVLAASGIKTFVCNRDVPTPVISYEILRRGCAGAINFTASHNPPEYNGIKFSPAWGGPALPESTRDIERRANGIADSSVIGEMALGDALEKGLVEEIDPKGDYLRDLEDKIDFAAIARLGARQTVRRIRSADCGNDSACDKCLASRKLSQHARWSAHIRFAIGCGCACDDSIHGRGYRERAAILNQQEIRCQAIVAARQVRRRG